MLLLRLQGQFQHHKQNNKMANIKADSALISAAGAAARSAGPISMQSSVDKLVTTHGFVMNQVADSWAQAMKSFEFEKNAASQEMAKLEESLVDASMPLEEQQAYEDFIQEQRNSIKEADDDVEGDKQGFLGIGTGKRKAKKKAREDARKKAIYELNQAIKLRQKDSDAGLSLTNKLKPENLPLLPKNTDPIDLEIAKEWAKVTRGEESEFMTKKLVDGRIVYTFKKDGFEVSKNTEDIANSIRSKDLTAATAINKEIKAAGDYALKNKNADINDIFNRLNNNIKTTFENNPVAYTDAMYETMGNQEQSIADALHTPGTAESLEIHAALKQIATEVKSVEGLNLNDDGVINAEDFDNPENYKAFVKEILSPSDENRDLVHRWAAGAIMRTEVDKAFGVGEKQRNINNQEKDKLSAAERLYQVKQAASEAENKKAIEQLRNGDKLVQLGLNTTAVRMGNGNYIIMNRTDAGKAVQATPETHEFLIPNDIIKYLGGEIEEVKTNDNPLVGNFKTKKTEAQKLIDKYSN